MSELRYNHPSENVLFIRTEQSASIEQAIERALSPLHAETVSTYQSDPPSVDNEDVAFVSPVDSAFTVKAKLRVGGEIVQPPIDLNDIVYFDG